MNTNMSMHKSLHAYMHTYTHIHAYMHTWIHAYTLTCIHAYMHASKWYIHMRRRIEEELRGGVRAAIAQFDQRREKAEMRRMERAEKEQRRVERLAAAAPGLARTVPCPGMALPGGRVACDRSGPRPPQIPHLTSDLSSTRINTTAEDRAVAAQEEKHIQAEIRRNGIGQSRLSFGIRASSGPNCTGDRMGSSDAICSSGDRMGSGRP